jgi:NADH dehydrogenase (ubiquinone) Fe-S protein 3
MATKLGRSRALASALRPTKPSIQSRGDQALRCISATARSNVAMPADVKNMRQAPRDHPKKLEVPIVNPADKYQTKANDLHRYGSWLMGSLPKYIQQFSVWKDELVIYISPAGVIPVFSFLKCMRLPIPSLARSPSNVADCRQHRCRIHASHHRHCM